MGESWGDLYAHALPALRSSARRSTNLASYDTGTRKRSFRNFKHRRGARPPTATSATTSPARRSTPTARSGTASIWDLRAALMKRREGQGRVRHARWWPTRCPSPGRCRPCSTCATRSCWRSGPGPRASTQSLLWTVFARHGMGASAISGKGDTARRVGRRRRSTPGPVRPPHRSLNGTVSGRLVDARTGKPVKDARVIVGRVRGPGHARRPKTAKSGTFSFPIMGGRSYPLTIAAEGYGVQRLTITPKAGKTLRLRIAARRELRVDVRRCDDHGVVEPLDARARRQALDDTQASVWWTDADDTATASPSSWTSAGTAPVTLKRLQISAMRGDRREPVRGAQGLRGPGVDQRADVQDHPEGDVQRAASAAARGGPAAAQLHAEEGGQGDAPEVHRLAPGRLGRRPADRRAPGVRDQRRTGGPAEDGDRPAVPRRGPGHGAHRRRPT